MELIYKKLRKNDLIFTLLFLAFGLMPILLKLALTRVLGPTFNFYFFVLWIPLVTIFFSVFRGWREIAITSIFIIAAFLFSLVRYPLNPPMDFRRQIVHQLDLWIIFAVLASWGALIVLPKLKNKTI